jgi:HTH-type transcriptional regulator / antitoxin HigA
LSSPERGFIPRWASPPADTIRTILRERHLSLSAFSAAMKLPDGRITAIISGTEPISVEIAQKLSTVVGGSVGFWIARDGQYREDLSRLKADKWSQTLPINDMAEFGWIDRPADWIDRIDFALRFFDIPDVNAWTISYLRPLKEAHLRAPAAQAPRDESLAVWLRQAERQAGQLACQPWDRDRFDQALLEVRPLTRFKDPAKFIPQLQMLCASVGVAVVVVRAPDGCNVSGAARVRSGGTGLIALTARYLTDDHFWFTFFHEAAHLLLEHRAGTYVDELPPGASAAVSEDERAADDFAARQMISEDGLRDIDRMRPRMREIVKLAHKLGVAPGIIVGQLQFRGRLGFGSGMNHLKRRYQWNGASLEMRGT